MVHSIKDILSVTLEGNYGYIIISEPYNECEKFTFFRRAFSMSITITIIIHVYFSSSLTVFSGVIPSGLTQ